MVVAVEITLFARSIDDRRQSVSAPRHRGGSVEEPEARPASSVGREHELHRLVQHLERLGLGRQAKCRLGALGVTKQVEGVELRAAIGAVVVERSGRDGGGGIRGRRRKRRVGV